MLNIDNSESSLKMDDFSRCYSEENKDVWYVYAQTSYSHLIACQNALSVKKRFRAQLLYEDVLNEYVPMASKHNLNLPLDQFAKNKLVYKLYLQLTDLKNSLKAKNSGIVLVWNNSDVVINQITPKDQYARYFDASIDALVTFCNPDALLKYYDSSCFEELKIKCTLQNDCNLKEKIARYEEALDAYNNEVNDEQYRTYSELYNKSNDYIKTY